MTCYRCGYCCVDIKVPYHHVALVIAHEKGIPLEPEGGLLIIKGPCPHRVETGPGFFSCEIYDERPFFCRNGPLFNIKPGALERRLLEGRPVPRCLVLHGEQAALKISLTLGLPAP